MKETPVHKKMPASLISYRRRKKTRLKMHRSMSLRSKVGCPLSTRLATGLQVRGWHRRWRWSHGFPPGIPERIGRSWRRINKSLVMNLHNPCATRGGSERGNANLKNSHSDPHQEETYLEEGEKPQCDPHQSPGFGPAYRWKRHATCPTA